MLERTIEEFLIQQAKAAGGLTLKLGNQHWPDRLVILPRRAPDGALLRPAWGFAELKRHEKGLRRAQALRLQTLQGVGCVADVCASLGAVKSFLDNLHQIGVGGGFDDPV